MTRSDRKGNKPPAFSAYEGWTGGVYPAGLDRMARQEGHRMRRAGTSLLFVILAVACSRGGDDSPKAAAPTTLASTTTTVADCPAIRQLLEARYLADALSALAANPSCDPDGSLRRRIAADRGKVQGLLAEAVAANGRKDGPAQRRALLAAAVLDAGDPEIRDALKKLNTAAPTTTTSVDPFVAASNLYDAGYETEAHALVADALKSGKTLPAKDSGKLDKHRGLAEWLADNWVRLSVVAFILSGMVALEVHRRQARDAPSKKWWVRRPRLVVEAGTGPDAPAMGVLVRDFLRVLASTGHAERLQISGASDATVPLPDISEIDAKLKPFQAAVKWAFREDRLHVAPLLAKQEQGKSQAAGVELYDELEARSTRWWVPTLADSGRSVQVAAAYAAGWVALTAPSFRPHLADHIDGTQAGTGDPLSLACLLAGVEALDAGAPDEAARLFKCAVKRDKNNERARNNLAVVLGNHFELVTMMEAAVILLELANPTEVA